MSFTRKQTVIQTFSTTATATATFSATCTAGNLIVVMGYGNNNSTGVTMSTGSGFNNSNTGFGAATIKPSTGSVNVFWKISAGTEKTLAITCAGSTNTIINTYEFSFSGSAISNKALTSGNGWATGNSSTPSAGTWTDGYFDSMLLVAGVGYPGTITSMSSNAQTGWTTTVYSGTNANLWSYFMTTNTPNMAGTTVLANGANLGAIKTWGIGAYVFYETFSGQSSSLNMSYQIVGTSNYSNLPTLGV